MAKAARRIPAANGDTSSPKKSAGGSTQKYKPSPQKTSPKNEGKKPKIVNLKHPDGTCYGWAFFASSRRKISGENNGQLMVPAFSEY